MKVFFFSLTLLLSFNSFNASAVDSAITEDNDRYFDILTRVEIVKDKSRSLIERQKEFSNIANEFGDPGAHWQTLKIAIIEIIISDASFWANEMTQFPVIQEKLMNDFTMDWYQDETSNYSEKLSLAKTELIRELEKIEKRKKILNDLKSKLERTRATTLE